VAEITQYLNSLSIKLGKYQNIADFMIKMAQAPHLVRFNLTFDELRNTYDTSILPKIDRQIDVYLAKYDGFKAKFSFIQDQRSVSSWI
jgi:hypothetical protein